MTDSWNMATLRKDALAAFVSDALAVGAQQEPLSLAKSVTLGQELRRHFLAKIPVMPPGFTGNAASPLPAGYPHAEKLFRAASDMDSAIFQHGLRAPQTILAGWVWRRTLGALLLLGEFGPEPASWAVAQGYAAGDLPDAESPSLPWAKTQWPHARVLRAFV